MRLAICAGIVAVGSLLLAGPALAGGSLKDTPAPLKMAWQGLYVGAQASYNSTDADGKWDTSGPTPFVFDSLDLDGWGGGAVIGYNQRIGTLMIGVEADYTGLSISDDQLDGEAPNRQYNELSLSSLATIRGRAGYVHENRVLIYGTIGIGQVKGDLSLEQGLSNFKGDRPQFVEIDETGLVYGGGVEFMVARNVSLKLEYLRFDVDSWYDLSKLVDGDPGDRLGLKAIDSFRIGVNIHLN